MTKKFGIIGNPIKHSLSPILHNYWFKKYKIDAKYTLLDVTENNLSKIIKKLKNKDLVGVNVTLPYKQKIVPYLDVLVNDAEATTATCVDFLSNGFKFRNSHNSQNRNGDTFIYMAFAEQPGTTAFDTFPNAR